jgi:excisionase family DNA binding protein
MPANNHTQSGAFPNQHIAASIAEVCRISGMTRSEIYRRLAAGDIRAVKNGRRTLILIETLSAYFARLPAATFPRRDAS